MLIKERNQSSSEVQLFLQVPRGALQMTSFWFPSIWMCLFFCFSSCFLCRSPGCPLTSGEFPGTVSCWVPLVVVVPSTAMPCVHVISKVYPETLCSPQPWLLLVNAGAALGLEWAWIKLFFILFMYKKRKSSLGDFSVTRQTLLLWAVDCLLELDDAAEIYWAAVALIKSSPLPRSPSLHFP